MDNKFHYALNKWRQKKVFIIGTSHFIQYIVDEDM